VFGYCIVVSLTALVLFVIKQFYKVYTLFSHTHLTTLSQLLAVGGVTQLRHLNLFFYDDDDDDDFDGENIE